MFALQMDVSHDHTGYVVQFRQDDGMLLVVIEIAVDEAAANAQKTILSDEWR